MSTSVRRPKKKRLKTEETRTRTTYRRIPVTRPDDRKKRLKTEETRTRTTYRRIPVRPPKHKKKGKD